ncbi:MAG: HEAT repeat domain-containing protein [Myxococcota bacterium]
MQLLLITLFSLLPLDKNPKDQSKDPLLGFPLKGRQKNISYFERNYNNWKQNNEGKFILKAYKNPQKTAQELYTSKIKESYKLKALGIINDRRLINYYKTLLPSFHDAKWILSLFEGLSRSQNIKDHQFIAKHIPYYNLHSSGFKTVFTFMAINYPETLAPLILDGKLAPHLIKIFTKHYDSAFVPYLDKAFHKNIISKEQLLNFTKNNFFHFNNNHKKLICKHLLQNLKPGKVNNIFYYKDIFKIIGACPKSIHTSKWKALLGNKKINLLMIKNMIKNNNFFEKDLLWPFSFLLKHYKNQTGWTKLILEVMGRIKSKKAVKTVASYVLTSNLWLRENALETLAAGTLRTSGKMLHAAALETAGEEAVMYFSPYLHNSRNFNYHNYDQPLLKLALKYLRAKNQDYINAAAFTLATAPENNHENDWYPVVLDYLKKLEKDKNHSAIAGLMPIIARASSSDQLLKKYLNSDNHNIRIGTVLALGFRKSPIFLKPLYKFAFSPDRMLAVNSVWSLARTPGSFPYLLKIISRSNLPAVFTNALAGINRIKLADKQKKNLCSVLFKRVTARDISGTNLINASSYLLKQCPNLNAVIFKKWINSLSLKLINHNLIFKNSSFFEPSSLPEGHFFTRKLSKFHTGKEGKKFDLHLHTGEKIYGFSTTGGIVFIDDIDSDPHNKIFWFNPKLKKFKP